MTELVRVTTELQLVRALECRVPNKRALIAALYKVGAVIGAPEAEVSQVIELLQGWQRTDYTKHRLSRWSYEGRIAENASLSEWRLPAWREGERRQLPAWANDLHFRVERQGGEILLKDLECKDIAYADLANALGVDPEPPASGYSVRMTLPRVHKSWCFGEGVVLPLRPFMAVLRWFFEEPCVRMLEDERQRYAEEHSMALDEFRVTWDHDEVAPYGDWLQLEGDLGEYLERRFTADFWGGRIEFIEDTDDAAPRKEPRHAHLREDGFWASMSLVHPTTPDVSVGFPGPTSDSFACGDGEYLLTVDPPQFGYWDSSDYIEDTAVVELTFGFSARPPYTLAQKQELQCRADEFAAKLRELFEPVMQTMQSPLQ